MDRMTVVLPLALLALTGPAMAAESEDGGVDATATAVPHLPVPASVAREGHARRGSRGATSKAARPSSTRRTTSTASRPSTGPTHTAPASSSARTVVYPTPGRPGHTVVHTTPARPGHTVVHTAPGRPVVHTVPARPPTVVHHAVPARPAVRTVTYTHVYPYHGVFVYGPRPVTHVEYVRRSGPVEVARTDLPKREINRNDSLAIGLKAGSLISGSPDGGVYGDPGLGLVGRYRPDESVGLELAVSHHGMTLDPLNARSQTQLAGSVELFAYPWTRVSPYVIGGVTMNAGSVTDELWAGDTYVATTDVSTQLGLHGGLGLELAMGKSVALDLEGRYIGWVTDSTPDLPSAPGALQATAGLVVHFK